MPIFLSTVAILLFAPAFNNLLLTSFSRARTTPSLHLMPTAVPPFSTALTAYSTCLDKLPGRGGLTLHGVPESCGHRARRQSWTGHSLCLLKSTRRVGWILPQTLPPRGLTMMSERQALMAGYRIPCRAAEERRCGLWPGIDGPQAVVSCAASSHD